MFSWSLPLTILITSDWIWPEKAQVFVSSWTLKKCVNWLCFIMIRNLIICVWLYQLENQYLWICTFLIDPCHNWNESQEEIFTANYQLLSTLWCLIIVTSRLFNSGSYVNFYWIFGNVFSISGTFFDFILHKFQKGYFNFLAFFHHKKST